MLKELADDAACEQPKRGCLLPWAKQGVLLLNTVLTVREGKPQSHEGIGWETFTDRIITLLNQKTSPVVFLLWGSRAQLKKKLITSKQHAVLESAHPSPLSAYRGFFGSKPYSRANAFLTSSGESPIHWLLPEE